jgi:uncharacterized protein (DUF4213/DUF364 family)
MSDANTPDILEQIRPQFLEIIRTKGLARAGVTVLAKPLTPEEAIGEPGRRDFPIIAGRERVVEARVRDAKGHAFTDSVREFQGLLEEAATLELATNRKRAVFVAVLNATLRHLAMASGTVHCKDDEPETCAREIAALLRKEHGPARIGLIGLNPAIAERLVDAFGADRVTISDLNRDNVDGDRFGVRIWDGNRRTAELIARSDVVLCTGTTLVNGTFDSIRKQVLDAKKEFLVYGVTAAGVCALTGIRRVCPCGRDD